VENKEVVMTILNHGEESNLLTWQERVWIIGSQKFGILVTNVIKNSDYQLPDAAPNVEDYTHMVEAFGVAKYEVDLQDYRYNVRKISEKKSEFYWFMWAHMSPESMYAVKSHCPNNFDEFEGRDPLALWMAIKETHGVN